MPNYFEYTTVTDVRAVFLSIVGTGDDALMLDLVRSVSHDMNSSAKRQFAPTIETLVYDAPIPRAYAYPYYGTSPYLYAPYGMPAQDLRFDLDVLEILSLTNGDSTTLAASTYWLYPANQSPKNKLTLKPEYAWQLDASGHSQQVISMSAIVGYHEDYAAAWAITDTLSAAITTTTATSATTTGSALLKAGQLIKIDSEYLYVSGVATTTATVVRGVNGSTAATHLINAPISVWTVDDAISQIARECTAARYRLRNNPLAESFVASDGTTFTSLKDIAAYIDKRLKSYGARREVLA